tara:strand:+ start:14 stop:694 length:681 start_codon:yes stop_codon:yes gene_type:complete
MTHSPVQPKDAASVMLIRSGSRGLEILFLRRNPSLAFQGDHWVFPGGRIDPIDKDVDRPHDELAAAQKAAVREAAEESGVSVPLHSLVYAIHWTTPVTSPIRFSTSFFIAPAPPEDILVDGNEIHEFLWLRPADALARHRARTFKLAAPTFALITRINAFRTVDEALLGVAAWPNERLIGEIRETEDGRVALYYPDIAYGGGALSADGPRHRLWMVASGWHYERSH